MFVLAKLNFKSFSQIQKIYSWCIVLVASFLFVSVVIYFLMNHPNANSGYSFNIFLLIAILLMPLNIVCESLKLYYKLHHTSSLFQIVRQVCKGYTFSIFIPFGLGSFIGRLLFAKEKVAVEMIKITAVTSIIQTICNLNLGLLLGYPIFKKWIEDNQSTFWNSFLFTLGILGLSMIGIKWMVRFENTLFQKIKKEFIARWTISSTQIVGKDMLVYSGLSMLRYLVYSTQCILIVMSFTGMEISASISAVAIFFMIVSMIYLPGILSVLSRTAISCFVFSFIGMQMEQAIFFSWFIFLLNILVPALFGVYYLFDDVIQTV